MDCVEELKESEKECIALQATIAETKTAKGFLLDDIVDKERQAMLYEKKIQLAKEVKQALDPTVGKAENENMEKEIHRMEIRLEALKREQDRLSAEMVRAIEKRATIATRYASGKPVQTSTGSGKAQTKELTQATAKKRIGLLKRESRVLAEDISQYSAVFEEKKAKLADMTFELEKRTAMYGEAEENCHQLQSNINDLLYRKQLLQERIAYRQKYATRLREVSQAGIDLGQALPVERKLLSSVQALDNVKEIIEELQVSFPHLREVLERVQAMTDPGIDDLIAGTQLQLGE